MLRTSAKISDLFFSPGKPPLVEINGKLASAGARASLTSEDTRRIAADLIGNNQHAIENLKKLGSCDVSYSLPGSQSVSGQHLHAARHLRRGDAGNSRQGPRTSNR